MAVLTPGRPGTVGRAVGAIAPAAVLVLGMVAAVNILIPSLQASSLRPSASQTAWVVDSYTLVFACVLIPAGALGDRFGRKRGMLIGLALFAAGSALASVAPSVAMLMCGRALSGVGAALVLPATLAVTLARVAPAERPRAVALWSSLTGIGGVLGNLGGGLAVTAGGWRALFWAAVPIALAAAALIAADVPDQERHQDPVDGGGALLLTAGSVALLYGIIDAPQLGWGSWQVLGSLVVAVVLLAAFTRFELRQPHPMLDPRLFRLSGVRTGAIGILVLFFSLFGLFYVNAQYLQDVKGYSALLTGVAVLPLGAVMMIVGPRSPRVAARIGERATIVLGLLLLAAGLSLLSFWSAETPYLAYALMLALVSAGMGLAMPPLSGMIVHALPPTHAGVSSGLNSTTRELGSALGVAVLATILATRYSSHLPATLHDLSGPSGTAVRHSVSAALDYARHAGDPVTRDRLVAGTRAAFTSGTSLGLRVGAGLIVLCAGLVFRHHPDNRQG
jgi:EmrB/QacA subfamily drug resistance transporter